MRSIRRIGSKIKVESATTLTRQIARRATALFRLHQGILLSLCAIPGRLALISLLNKFARMCSPLITILSENSAWRAGKNCTKLKVNMTI
jgi:hypothetical protein